MLSHPLYGDVAIGMFISNSRGEPFCSLILGSPFTMLGVNVLGCSGCIDSRNKWQYFRIAAVLFVIIAVYIWKVSITTEGLLFLLYD